MFVFCSWLDFIYLLFHTAYLFSIKENEQKMSFFALPNNGGVFTYSDRSLSASERLRMPMDEEKETAKNEQCRSKTNGDSAITVIWRATSDIEPNWTGDDWLFSTTTRTRFEHHDCAGQLHSDLLTTISIRRSGWTGHISISSIEDVLTTRARHTGGQLSLALLMG